MTTAVLVGAGVIGRGWIQVFTRAGCRVRLFDPEPNQLERAIQWLDDDLARNKAEGACSPGEAAIQRALVSTHADLSEALAGAGYVQESVPERLEAKRAIFTRIDALAAPETIIASSTSALDVNDIAGGLAGERRCLMAHPFNPPHIIPVVEIMGCRGTDPAMTQRAVDFLTSVGQKPVMMKRYAVGYLLNRIQAAVVREAVNMVASGLAGVDAVDTVIRDGLALRWAILGNFGTNNANADGGIREYYTRYGKDYQAIMNDLYDETPSFAPDLIEEIGRQVDAREGTASIKEICRWRDRMILTLRDLKIKHPHP